MQLLLLISGQLKKKYLTVQIENSIKAEKKIKAIQKKSFGFKELISQDLLWQYTCTSLTSKAEVGQLSLFVSWHVCIKIANEN